MGGDGSLVIDCRCYPKLLGLTTPRLCGVYHNSLKRSFHYLPNIVSLALSRPSPNPSEVSRDESEQRRDKPGLGVAC